MQCTLAEMASAEYLDCNEKQDSGLTDLMTVWDPNDIETFPTSWESMAGQQGFAEDGTIYEAKLTISGTIAMKATKKPKKVPCILETGLYTAKSVGNSWEVEVKTRIQKTLNNEGFVDDLLGRKFLFGFQENDGPVRVLGRTTGVTSGYLALIKKDSVQIVGGDTIGSDKYIEFIVMAKKYLPAVYNGTITY